MIDYDKFKKSLKHLELQFENYNKSRNRTGFTELDNEALAESVVHRFETCYDCLWKILKRYLNEELGVPEVPNSPKPIFRLAFENKLFPSVERWLRFADARIDTSHDYSGEKAEECLKLQGDFIEDAVRLYQTLTGETWE